MRSGSRVRRCEGIGQRRNAVLPQERLCKRSANRLFRKFAQCRSARDTQRCIHARCIPPFGLDQRRVPIMHREHSKPRNTNARRSYLLLRIGINYLFLRIRIDLLNLIAQLIENNRLQKADYLTFVSQHLELHCGITL